MALLLVAATAACTAETDTDAGGAVKSPFADCAALTSAPTPTTTPSTGSAPRASAGSGAAGSVAAGAAGRVVALPDLGLPCFTGGSPVRLSALRGPAVINLWASWCQPCREELPAMQRLADATTGRLHVVGVDTADDRGAAVDFATDRKVTLATLDDPDRTLSAALGQINLPITVFVDPAGRATVYDQAPPDDAQLAVLVRAHTGVSVQP